MKAITFLFVLVACKSFAQHNVYTPNNGTYMDEDKVRSTFNIVRKSVPSTYNINAVIYNKVIKQDTIINYYNFVLAQRPASEGAVSPDLKFEFKQDSTFLLLNQKLPSFKLKDIDGKEVTSDDLLGKPTLINFWAIYCGPCIAEMPELSRLKEKYKDKVNFVSITENNAANDHLHTFLKDKDFNFRVLQDGEWYKKELKLAAIPRNLFIDKNGILRSIQVNYPIVSGTKSVAIDDKNNYFVILLDSLISQRN